MRSRTAFFRPNPGTSPPPRPPQKPSRTTDPAPDLGPSPPPGTSLRTNSRSFPAARPRGRWRGLGVRAVRASHTRERVGAEFVRRSIAQAGRAQAEATIQRNLPGRLFAFTAVRYAVRTADRPAYLPTTYVVPRAGHEAALGHGLRTGPTRPEVTDLDGITQAACCAKRHRVRIADLAAALARRIRRHDDLVVARLTKKLRTALGR